MAKPVASLRLSTGADIPAIGFGTFADVIVPGQMQAAVLAALDAGYRHLDCAWYYKNESEVGSALQSWLTANPNVKRKDIFVTTKVWTHLLEPDDVEWSLNNSLQNLKVDYVDTFLIHWPFASERTDDREVKLGADGKYIIKKELTANLAPAWRAMESLQLSGKTRSIGVSNYDIHHLEALLAYAEIRPAINQVEIHPYFPNTELIEFCKMNDILPVAYSPLGSQGQVKDLEGLEDSKVSVLTDQTLAEIAKMKSGSVAQICIAWGTKRGYPVLPKSSNPERLRANFEVLELSETEFEQVNGIANRLGEKDGKGLRFVNPKGMFGLDNWKS
ncbi:putative alcohol dehydrogenase [Amylocarpus encephaloides]|uniref:Alcohol dehydrogenase n=1 Tax=Amylocarpus encephaloides TaxID=45428 RepID=A0A9P8C731_9HELO|nr:putative alcohol dehydrogenase [Amylocarpus encephaloides]